MQYASLFLLTVFFYSGAFSYLTAASAVTNPKKSGKVLSASKNNKAESGKPANVQSWKEALEAAYDFNPDLQEARSRVRQQKDGLMGMKSEWMPRVSADVSYGYNDTKEDSAITGIRTNKNTAFSYGAKLSQNISNFGGTQARINSSRASVQAAEFALQQKEAEVFTAVMRTFLEVVMAQRLIRFNEGNVERSKQMHRRAEARFQVGQISKTDVLISAANKADAEARLAESHARLLEAEASFKSLTGKALEKNIDWPEALGEKAGQDCTVLLRQALQKNPSVLGSLSEERAAKSAVHAKLSEQMLPSVDVNASASQVKRQNRQVVGGLGSPDVRQLTADVVLRVPLPLGSQQAVVRQSEQNLAQTKAKRRSAQLSLQSAVQSNCARLGAALRSVSLHEIEHESQKMALIAMQAEFLEGKRSLVDVSEVQDREERSYQKLVEAKKQYFTESIALKRAMGNFTARALKLNVAYNEAKDYSPWLGLSPQQAG